MNSFNNHWVVCQIGAREHYSVARSLHLHRGPVTLLTDFWSAGRSLGLPARLAQRCHPDLADADVEGFNAAYLRFVASSTIKRLQHWDWIVAQNHWFSERAAKLISLRCQSEALPDVVFSYSYAARSIFQTAKKFGCTTVLGQIDPGPVEMRLVRRLYERAGCKTLLEPPSSYWDQWHEECDLADAIIVNSSWSRDALIEEGIAAEKLTIIPLAYEAEQVQRTRHRAYPVEFTVENPLTVLFLGQVIRRKGAAELLGAVEAMADEAVRWSVVGPGDEDLLAGFRRAPHAAVRGPATRMDAMRYYRDADVFILPTHSDGFALTQLEAASYGLPVIASRFCGDVVRDNDNGIVINEVTTDAIVNSIRSLIADPSRLSRMAKNQANTRYLSLGDLAERLRDAASRASRWAGRSVEAPS